MSAIIYFLKINRFFFCFNYIFVEFGCKERGQRTEECLRFDIKYNPINFLITYPVSISPPKKNSGIEPEF